MIKPKQLEHMITEDERAEIVKFEPIIDKALIQNRHSANKNGDIEIRVPDGFYSMYLPALKECYCGVDKWFDIKWWSDPNGDWHDPGAPSKLIFITKPPKKKTVK